MPELPEVESIRRGLSELEGLPVTTAEARDPDLFRDPLTPDRFERRVTGSRLLRADRRGKFLLLRFSSGTLVISVRMTGLLTLGPTNPRSPDRLGFRLAFEGIPDRLYFTTVRRLSRLEWFGPEDPEPDSLSRLGPDPLEDRDFVSRVFERSLPGRRGPIKPLLMDQSFLAGVGNIYASELCYHHRLDPRHPVGQIPRSSLLTLFESVPVMLRRAVAVGGSSFTHFRDARHEPGRYHHYHRVYNRAGERCLGCGETIRQVTQSGRSTFYCPECQGRGNGRTDES